MKTTLLLLVTLLTAPFSQAEELAVSDFANQGLKNWQEKSFVDHTDYQIIQENHQAVLKAESHKAASGLFREIDVDLNKTPYLNWRWKIANDYSGLDERSKQGDDYPARLYVVVSGGLLFWKTKALNYVWSSSQPTDSHWDNAYTGNAKMLALRSKGDKKETWYQEKRNVKADLKKLFGEEFDEINAVAIMTDSDNGKQSATAYYGDIFFSTQ